MQIISFNLLNWLAIGSLISFFYISDTKASYLLCADNKVCTETSASIQLYFSIDGCVNFCSPLYSYFAIYFIPLQGEFCACYSSCSALKDSAGAATYALNNNVCPTGSIPTSNPTSSPTSSHPTSNPTSRPTNPTSQPSSSPSSKPSSCPTSKPTTIPTSKPSSDPTSKPTCNPTSKPSNPTSNPTFSPTSQPTSSPTSQPSSFPSSSPTSQPTSSPTSQPSSSPTSQPTSSPTSQPSSQPTSSPTPSTNAFSTGHISLVVISSAVSSLLLALIAYVYCCSSLALRKVVEVKLETNEKC